MDHGPHHSDEDIVKRMNRATGQLRSVVGMIERQRPCVDIAKLLHAIEAAVAAAKRTLIRDHIDHCLSHADDHAGAQAAIAEFRTISRYW
jgi:DNA-binding FrmR family transcriptional regulator